MQHRLGKSLLHLHGTGGTAGVLTSWVNAGETSNYLCLFRGEAAPPRTFIPLHAQSPLHPTKSTCPGGSRASAALLETSHGCSPVQHASCQLLLPLSIHAPVWVDRANPEVTVGLGAVLVAAAVAWARRPERRAVAIGAEVGVRRLGLEDPALKLVLPRHRVTQRASDRASLEIWVDHRPVFTSSWPTHPRRLKVSRPHHPCRFKASRQDAA